MRMIVYMHVQCSLMYIKARSHQIGEFVDSESEAEHLPVCVVFVNVPLLCLPYGVTCELLAFRAVALVVRLEEMWWSACAKSLLPTSPSSILPILR